MSGWKLEPNPCRIREPKDVQNNRKLHIRSDADTRSWNFYDGVQCRFPGPLPRHPLADPGGLVHFLGFCREQAQVTEDGEDPPPDIVLGRPPLRCSGGPA